MVFVFFVVCSLDQSRYVRKAVGFFFAKATPGQGETALAKGDQ